MNQLLLSLAQLGVAAVLSALAAFLSFFLFQRLTRGVDETEALRAGNPAVALVMGAIMLSVAIVLRPALALDTAAWDAGRALLARGLLAQALQLVVGLALALGAVILALWAFSALTRGIDEVVELRRGNVAIGTVLACVVLAVGLVVSQPIDQVMQALTAVVF